MMIKNKFVKAKNWFCNSFKIKESFFCCLISIITFSLIFVAGALSNETKIERCADYYSQIVSNHTTSNGDKKLSGLIVEPKLGHEVSMAYDTQTEITNLWGVFKGENTSFAPVINANKNADIRFAGEEGKKYCDNNLSILYSSLGVFDEPYHFIEQIDEQTNEKKKVAVDYKFQCSPLAVMFPSSRYGWKSEIYIYISQRQAENKLKAENRDINEDSLRSILNTTVDINFDGEIKTCIIQNIYLDNFEHDYSFPNTGLKYNYYYGTDVGTVLGDFIFISFYAIENKIIPKCLSEKQGMYFMSEYSFRNKYYLKYAKECYSPTDYDFDYARANINDGFIPDKTILENSLDAKGNNVLCLLLTILIIIVFCVNLVLICFFRLYGQPLSTILIGIASVLPYLTFKLLYIFTINTNLFSSYSLMFELILLAVLAVTIGLFNCFSRHVVAGETHV